MAPEDRLALTIVGPRSPSAYARLMAESLAPALAAHGLTLVSGLAHGIDAVAHRAALDSPAGRTLAVLGQGLGTPISPEINRPLAERVVEEDRGALIIFFPLATAPAPGLFPPRNEIMAGLALGTLVIEAGPTSGGLITARHAAAFGRTVLACPGDATRRAARGSNRLIADGAALVQEAEDVLAALGPDLRHALATLRPLDDADAHGPSETKTDADAPALMSASDPLDAALFEALADEPLPFDALLERLTGVAPAPGVVPNVGRVQQRLLMLELDGRLRRLPGQVYALARHA